MTWRAFWLLDAFALGSGIGILVGPAPGLIAIGLALVAGVLAIGIDIGRRP